MTANSEDRAAIDRLTATEQLLNVRGLVLTVPWGSTGDVGIRIIDQLDQVLKQIAPWEQKPRCTCTDYGWAFDKDRAIHDMRCVFYAAAVETGTNQLLEEILAELRKSNSVAREGAVSSVAIEDMAKGPPKITTKRYTGSDLEIDLAIEDHARAHAEAERRWKEDWSLTLEANR